PSKSKTGATLGRPTTTAAVRAAMITQATKNQRRLNPCCWKRLSSSSTGFKAGTSSGAPHDTQRARDVDSLFLYPQLGHCGFLLAWMAIVVRGTSLLPEA